MNEQEFSELAAGYALNALSPDDLARFEAARLAHPDWEVVVDLDRDTAVTLADGVAEVLPPLTMRSSILSRIAATPQGDAPAPAPAPLEEPRIDPAPTTSTIQAISRRNWTRSLLALAASMVLLVSLGFGAAMVGEWLNRTPADIVLADIEAAPDARSATAALTDGGTATAYWSDELGQAVLVTNGLPEITDDQTFEMWFVRADGTPVSAGLLEPGVGPVTAILAGEVEPGDTIAISVEADGGSTEGAPTTEPIVLIPTA